MTAIETRPVGPDQLSALGRLFDSSRNTRRCWCMAPCLERGAFSVGWVTGGNRRRFSALAAASDDPMGVLAAVSGEPVGWCACGPRSRYLARLADHGGSDADDGTWLVACFYVHPDHRSSGVTRALLRSAVAMASAHGATAIEGSPATGPDARADAFRGSAELFAELGFQELARSDARRVRMRLELP